MAEVKRRWSALFEFFDVDGNGVLTAADIRAACKKAIALAGNEQAENAQARFAALAKPTESLLDADLNEDGKVTKSEWSTWVRAQLTADEPDEYTLSESLEAIGEALFLVHGRSATTEDDYVRYMHTMHVESGEDELRAHWKVVVARFGSGGELTAEQYDAWFEAILTSRDASVPFLYPL